MVKIDRTWQKVTFCFTEIMLCFSHIFWPLYLYPTLPTSTFILCFFFFLLRTTKIETNNYSNLDPKKMFGESLQNIKTKKFLNLMDPRRWFILFQPNILKKNIFHSKSCPINLGMTILQITFRVRLVHGNELALWNCSPNSIHTEIGTNIYIQFFVFGCRKACNVEIESWANSNFFLVAKEIPNKALTGVEV